MDLKPNRKPKTIAKLNSGRAARILPPRRAVKTNLGTKLAWRETFMVQFESVADIISWGETSGMTCEQSLRSAGVQSS